MRYWAIFEKKLLKHFILLTLSFLFLPGLKAQGDLDSLDLAHEKMLTSDKRYWRHAFISAIDSSISLQADMKLDHRFFGYEKASENSAKLLLFSIFTNDVAGNPFQLRYGAYYETAGLKGRYLHYVCNAGQFIKAELREEGTHKLVSNLYFPLKWIVFDKSF